jgi:MFS family permease
MSKSQRGWSALFSDGRALSSIVLVGGVGLQAIEGFIGGTLFPSVVAEIGGIEMFSWQATFFIVASIIASVFAAMRPRGLGPRSIYLIAAGTFAVGSVICGLAPDMPVMLLGRAIQGFGAGLLNAMGYLMVRLVYPQPLWPRAFAMISSVWGVATLIGPAIGGIFATFHAWRPAFLLIAPLALLLGVMALRAIPKSTDEVPAEKAPILQILLLVGAVLAVSVASILTGGAMLPALLVGLAVLAIIALGVIDQHRDNRLLPTGSFVPGTMLSSLYVAMFLANLAIMGDVFVPLFLQQLHGLSPLIAGYMVALVALGWSSGSVTTAQWPKERSRSSLVVGPMLLAAANAGLAILVPQVPDGSAGIAVLCGIGVALYVLGLGVGICWPHLSSRVLANAPEGERDRTSAAISMVQLFSGGLGAALAGVVVNATGLTTGQPAHAAAWLFGSFVILPLIMVPIMATMVRREAAMAAAVPQPAE